MCHCARYVTAMCLCNNALQCFTVTFCVSSALSCNDTSSPVPFVDSLISVGTKEWKLRAQVLSSISHIFTIETL